jgi:hypothetical protein
MEAQPCVLGIVTLHMSLKTIYTHTEAPMQSVRYFCPIFTNLGVSRQIFVRAPNTKLKKKNPPSANRRDICGQR